MRLLAVADRVIDSVSQHADATGRLLKRLFGDLIEILIPYADKAGLAFLHILLITDDECAVDPAVRTCDSAKVAGCFNMLDHLSIPADLGKSFLMGQIDALL